MNHSQPLMCACPSGPPGCEDSAHYLPWRNGFRNEGVSLRQECSVYSSKQKQPPAPLKERTLTVG